MVLLWKHQVMWLVAHQSGGDKFWEKSRSLLAFASIFWKPFECLKYVDTVSALYRPQDIRNRVEETNCSTTMRNVVCLVMKVRRGRSMSRQWLIQNTYSKKYWKQKVLKIIFSIFPRAFSQNHLLWERRLVPCSLVHWPTF